METMIQTPEMEILSQWEGGKEKAEERGKEENIEYLHPFKRTNDAQLKKWTLEDFYQWYK